MEPFAQALEERYGPLKRQQVLFDHTAVQYWQSDDLSRVSHDQAEYARSLRFFPVKKERRKDSQSSLVPSE